METILRYVIIAAVGALASILANQSIAVFNDGLHRWPCTGMADEEFVGTVWALAVPRAVVDLADEIEAWQTEHTEELDSPYASESFGGYSYTRVGGDGSPITWRQQFKARLDPWRKL